MYKLNSVNNEWLEKKSAATDHTVCVYKTWLFVIAGDCVVCNCMCVCVCVVMIPWVPGRVASG